MIEIPAYEESKRLSAEERAGIIRPWLEQGRAVTIQGPSGSGKSSTLRGLLYSALDEGYGVAHLDMRHVRGPIDMREQLARMLGVSSSERSVMDNLQAGNSVLALDEYWAGNSFVTPLLHYAQRQGNWILTAAGLPVGLDHAIYTASKS